MTLVEVRCKAHGCGRLLDRVESAPAEGDEIRWAGPLRVSICPRHGGTRGSIAKWVEARRRLGLPHDRYPTGRWISWAELRPAVRQARLTFETQAHYL